MKDECKLVLEFFIGNDNKKVFCEWKYDLGFFICIKKE